MKLIQNTIGLIMINTKGISVKIGNSTYKAIIDYEQDGDIVAIVIGGDIKDLLTNVADDLIVEAFDEAMEE